MRASASAVIAESFTLTQIFVVGAAVMFSATVTAIAGFGFGLMSVPLMSLAVDVHSAVILSSISAVFANGVQAYLFRRRLVPTLARRLTIASVAGLPVGFAVFQLVGDDTLRILLGVAVVGAVIILSRGLDLTSAGPPVDWGLGFVSGVLNTSISTSGPPLVFCLQARRLAPDAFRATINLVFLVSNAVGLVIFASAGKIHGREIEAGAVTAPALGIGLALGMPLRTRFSPESFRILVLVLLVGGAAASVAKAIG